MTEALGIRIFTGTALVWGIVFIGSASGIVEALTAGPLLREGNINLGVGLALLLMAAVFFFGEESLVEKYRLGRERMDWWEPLPMSVGVMIGAPVILVDSLATGVWGG